MPRIPDKFLDCIVYIYPSRQSAESSDAAGATGFFLAMPTEASPDYFHLYVVTNAHVLDSYTPVLRINRPDGTSEILETRLDSWVRHPDGDDVAVYSIDTTEELQVAAIRTVELASEQVIAGYDIGIGDEVFFAGRLRNNDGTERNLPVLRTGIISRMPTERIVRRDGLAVESYFVEARSLSGFSGSPVLVAIGRDPRQRLERRVLIRLSGLDTFLLGIDSGHIEYRVPVVDGTGALLVDTYTNVNTGIMYVVPAWKLAELLFGEELVANRARDESELLKRLNAAPD
jgi:hypothetical protein